MAREFVKNNALDQALIEYLKSKPLTMNDLKHYKIERDIGIQLITISFYADDFMKTVEPAACTCTIDYQRNVIVDAEASCERGHRVGDNANVWSIQKPETAEKTRECVCPAGAIEHWSWCPMSPLVKDMGDPSNEAP